MEYRLNYEYFWNVQECDALGNMECRIQEALKLLEHEGDCIVLIDANGTETRCCTENELREILAVYMQ